MLTFYFRNIQAPLLRPSHKKTEDVLDFPPNEPVPDPTPVSCLYNPAIRRFTWMIHKPLQHQSKAYAQARCELNCKLTLLVTLLIT